MKTVCEENMCAGCMACIDMCYKNAISVIDNKIAFNAVIDEKKCISCNACKKVCQVNKPAKRNKPIAWYQGWTNNPTIRKYSSSGGVATELIKQFVQSGGYVASCTFLEGEFCFLLVSSIEEASRFSGSKYVKSNPKGIYKEIKNRLITDRVLFCGLPCQVAALKNFCGDNDNLYTIDLICHGSPSPKILENFLLQYDVKLNEIQDINFRKKIRYQLSYRLDNKEFLIDKDGITDNYSIAFLNGICFTENCYHCNYSNIERVSDITIGDSWGSNLEKAEQEKGISLILCQTVKGEQMLKDSNLVLKSVDLEKSISHNHQLVSPSEKPSKRDVFFDILSCGKPFNEAIRKVYPKNYYKQKIKKVLIFLRLI